MKLTKEEKKEKLNKFEKFIDDISLKASYSSENVQWKLTIDPFTMAFVIAMFLITLKIIF